jgi:hypothetical protein
MDARDNSCRSPSRSPSPVSFFFEPYGDQHITDVRTLNVAHRNVADLEERIGFQRGQPLVPMLLVLPALFVLVEDLGRRLSEGRNSLGFCPLEHGVDSCLNLRADFG